MGGYSGVWKGVAGATCVWGERTSLGGFYGGFYGGSMATRQARDGFFLLWARSPDERRRWWGMDGRACKATPVVGC